MPKYVTLEKLEGQTPLEAAEAYRQAHGLPLDVPLAYAGRLDPMASGKLLILIGEECKRQSEYHGLDKQYEFELLLGTGSDTGDILGIPSAGQEIAIPDEGAILDLCQELPGPISLPYPKFSSKTVRGKPLFLWTLEGRLSEIEMPVATTELYSLAYRGSYTLTPGELLKRIRIRIEKVTPVTEKSKALGADFRRADVRAGWDKTLTNMTGRFTVLKFSARCSSGTYIRSLAPFIAERLGTSGLAFSIHRTHIGRFVRFPYFTRHGIWTRSY